jgi:hypothetical protein
MKVMTVLLMAGTLLLGAGSALAANPEYRALSKAEMTSGTWQPVTYSHITGKVTAIATQSPTTLTIQSGNGQAERTVRVALNDQTVIRQGLFAERPADIKVGSHVWVDYEQVKGKLVADRIKILDPPVPSMHEPEGPDYR